MRSYSGKAILSEREQRNYTILELIRRHDTITKAQISQYANMNVVTVSNYVEHFIRKGLVIEKGLAISSGGRKPALIEINNKAGFVIGIDLGAAEIDGVTMTGVILEVTGREVAKLKKNRPKEDMESALSRSLEMVRELLISSKIEQKKLLGIGIGAHGIINNEAGTVRDNSRWGTRSGFLHILEQIKREYKLAAVFIGNSACLAAYGENRFGLAEDVQNMLYLHSDIGCGIILNRDIYYGSTGSAGALGVTAEVQEAESRFLQGLSGRHSVEMDLGIVDKAKKMLRDGIDSRLSNLVNGDIERINLKTIIKASDEDDTLAKELIQNAAAHLGVQIAYLVNVFNPDVVIVGGGFEAAGSVFLDPLSRAVRRWAFEEAGGHVDIVPSRLGEDSVAKGAAGFVIRNVFINA